MKNESLLVRSAGRRICQCFYTVIVFMVAVLFSSMAVLSEDTESVFAPSPEDVFIPLNITENNPNESGGHSCGAGCTSCEASCHGHRSLTQWILGAGPYYNANPYGTGAYGSTSSLGANSTGSGNVGANLARTGAVGATATAVPDMVGDSTFSAGKTLDIWGGVYGIWVPLDLCDVSFSELPAPSFALTRLNMAENFNSEVQNRIYFDYRHFNDSGHADGTISGDPVSRSYSVDRYTFGFEKTVARNLSLEFRLPVVTLMGSDQLFGCDPSAENSVPGYATELGNISLASKHVMQRTRNWTYTAGLGLNLPTASDVNYRFIDSDRANLECTKIRIKNQGCRLLPYYALQWHPSGPTFGHFLAQFDIPLNSNSVEVEVNDGVNTSKGYGYLTDETLLRLNASVGRWFYKNDRANYLNRIGTLFETHYTVNLTPMEDRACAGTKTTSLPNDEAFGFVNSIAPRDKNGNIRHHVSMLNLVGGIPVQMGKTTITPSVAVPVTDARHFSSELSVQVNRRF